MNFILVFIFVFLILSVAPEAMAQQTVFNVPSADVLEKGKVYAELDAIFKTNNQEALRRFSSFVPRVVAGVGGNSEIGLNLPGNVNPGADSTTIVATVKHRFYQSSKWNFTIYGGNNFYFPVRNRAYQFGTYTYVAAAKTFNKTRLTAGAFVFSKNVVVPNQARGGGQFTFEQTVNSKLTLATDWFTGRQASGFLTLGTIYKFTPKLTGYFAYSIGNANARKGNHFFLLEVGYNFN